MFREIGYIIDEVGVGDKGFVVASPRGGAKLHDGVINVREDVHIIISDSVNCDAVSPEIMSFGRFEITDMAVVEQVLFMTAVLSEGRPVGVVHIDVVHNVVEHGAGVQFDSVLELGIETPCVISDCGIILGIE